MSLSVLLEAGRLLQYLSLLLVFGLPLCGLWLRPAPEPTIRGDWGWSRACNLACVSLAILSSLLVGWLIVAEMVGRLAPAAVSPVASLLLLQTAPGHAFIGRIAALLVWLGLASLPGRPSPGRAWAQLLLGGVAVVTLAWAGHAAMDQGWRGRWHLGLDGLHLLAAGAWLAALVLLLELAGRHDPAAAPRLLRVGQGFAGLGLLIVLLLSLSGLVNMLLILGPPRVSRYSHLYGQLLVLKLGLFGGMLMLAASHRFRQLPALQRQLSAGDATAILRTLRRSLGLETVLAMLVLALVAWLGRLDPMA